MAGIDSDTHLMLHMNGADASTIFTDDSPSAHALTTFGTVQIDTAESVFGGASGLFDGDSDYLTASTSADFNVYASTATTFTIDFRINITATGSTEKIVSYYASSGDEWGIRVPSDGRIQARLLDGGAAVNTVSAGGEIFGDGNWQHVMWIKLGTEYGIYVDGTQVAYKSDASISSISGTLFVGQRGDGSEHVGGHLDEFRIQNSNYFSAAPDSGLTDTITVPVAEYFDPSAVSAAGIMTTRSGWWGDL